MGFDGGHEELEVAVIVTLSTMNSMCHSRDVVDQPL
jgi:hypothetical protein